MATELQRPPRVSLKGSVPRGRRGAARAAGNLALGGMAAEDFDVVDEVSQQRPHLDRVRVIASRGWCACLWGECVPICLGVHECVGLDWHESSGVAREFSEFDDQSLKL